MRRLPLPLASRTAPPPPFTPTPPFAEPVPPHTLPYATAAGPYRTDVRRPGLVTAIGILSVVLGLLSLLISGFAAGLWAYGYAHSLPPAPPPPPPRLGPSNVAPHLAEFVGPRGLAKAQRDAVCEHWIRRAAEPEATTAFLKRSDGITVAAWYVSTVPAVSPRGAATAGSVIAYDPARGMLSAFTSVLLQLAYPIGLLCALQTSTVRDHARRLGQRADFLGPGGRANAARALATRPGRALLFACAAGALLALCVNGAAMLQHPAGRYLPGLLLSPVAFVLCAYLALRRPRAVARAASALILAWVTFSPDAAHAQPARRAPSAAAATRRAVVRPRPPTDDLPAEPQARVAALVDRLRSAVERRDHNEAGRAAD